MRFTLAASLSATVLPALALGACDSASKSGTCGAGPTLSITSPKMDQTLADGSAVQVMFDVQNYALTGKIDPEKNPNGNGQHVHLIVDNEPYAAVYDVTTPTKIDPKLMTEGTHIIRAFPSAGPKDEKGAAHHESRKNDGAFAWVRFHVKSKGGPLETFDGKKPLLTYSRPKGTGATAYKVGSPEQKHFLVDFYVTNAKLGKGDLTVRATLDGKALPDFTEWKPLFLDGDQAPAVGDHTMTLELLDADGKPVEGPFNKTERKFAVVN
jgi:hypothetical protein